MESFQKGGEMGVEEVWKRGECGDCATSVLTAKRDHCGASAERI